jgi:hypothetical protein
VKPSFLTEFGLNCLELIRNTPISFRQVLKPLPSHTHCAIINPQEFTNLPIIHLLVKNKDSTPCPERFDPMSRQEGNIGRMKAVDKFEYQRGYKSGSYAT